MLDIKVGQTVWVEPVGNTKSTFDRNSPIDKLLKEATVTNVGRKYFSITSTEHCNMYKDRKFDLQTGRDVTAYAAQYYVHTDKAKMIREYELDIMWDRVRSKVVNAYHRPVNLSEEDVKALHHILAKEV